MAPTKLPDIPVPPGELVAYLAKQGKDASMPELLQPYRVFEKELRAVYAQERDHPALEDPYVNVLPLFTENTADIKIRARNLDAESEEEKSRYIMSLPDDKRKGDGAPATVKNIKEFLHNFNVFSESSLAELDWDHVVAAGSSVVNTLLPVPAEFASSKRALREYYHEKFCPASDVDLFLYGLETEEEAMEKIREIESSVKDAILSECTTVRTKNAITICSQYPTRHIQIVLRVYKSVSEILTGFDIDSACAAFDGKQVYCTPRALQSFMTQINYIDLSRRSPSYENRLSKYSHRNFEVYWAELDRSRIDPTIFERSFRRTLGLARLLVLERLPTSSARDKYLAQRREERGRPALNREYWSRGLHGNIKERHEDEIAEWVDEEDVSSYHTFSIPYGTKFNAKKIEKLVFTKDLLLNAEWNQPKEREVYLHRHPAFFGRVIDVVEDCCGFCPKPETDQEKEVAEHEAKTYVSGKCGLNTDDPGRQQIGSFNPLTEDDWTEMAYVGNTARLCQAIVDCDAEHVEDWIAQEGADPSKRDYTGRTPLHLACTSSTPEIVRLLVDKGARLVARLADGRTALHLAAERGNAEMVKILLDKSAENEAVEEEKKDRLRNEKSGENLEVKPDEKEDENEEEKSVDKEDEDEDDDENENSEDDDEDDEFDELDDVEDSEDGEARSMATGSFVKVKKQGETKGGEEGIPDEEKTDDPDFYDVNVAAWDTPVSALHLAIVGGHEAVVRLLCEEFGADVLLPVKFVSQNYQPEAAILALCLALSLPVEKAIGMTKVLLGLGATSVQADLNGFTAFHRFVENGVSTRLLDTLWEVDPNGAKAAMDHLSWTNNNQAIGPLQTAVSNGDWRIALKLLTAGAVAQIPFDRWLTAVKERAESRLSTLENNTKLYHSSTEQPLILALRSPEPASALDLLKRGADVNTLTTQSYNVLEGSWWRYYTGQTALDVVREQLKLLHKKKTEMDKSAKKPRLADGVDEALAGIAPGTWRHWIVSREVDSCRASYEAAVKQYEKQEEKKEKKQEGTQDENEEGMKEKKHVIDRMIKTFSELESVIEEKGGKGFYELHPDKKQNDNNSDTSSTEDNKDKPFEFKNTFHGVKDVTATREKAYDSLFEAAWAGDLEKIKALTLQSWGSAEDLQPPLAVAVEDATRTNLFAHAFLRGHFDAARGILEIAQAQYAPDEKEQGKRFTMSRPRDSDCYDSDESGETSDDEDGLRIFETIVDAKFTIDNIGEVSMQVKSRKKPLQMLLDTAAIPAVDAGTSEKKEEEREVGMFCVGRHSSTRPVRGNESLLSHVINKNDLAGLRFLLDVATQHCGIKLDADDEPTKLFHFPEAEFHKAVTMGRLDILAEVIKRTGAGLPLEDLVKNTGVELKEKPKYYQGLTVYGKKRKDWANAGRQVARKSANSGNTAPLLLAAWRPCIESVEWFLGDAPLRHYIDFSQTKAARDDARLKHLVATTTGGFERAVTRWLGHQNDLVMHAAILAAPYDKGRIAESYRLVEYLLKAYPAAVTTKSVRGYTPLLLACRMGRVDLVKLLVKHSDQSARDAQWDSILHAALAGMPKAAHLRQMLDIFDRDLRTQLFKERNSLTTAGGHTPLHSWIHGAKPGPNAAYKTDEEAIEVLNLLIEYSGGQELAMLDGAGDTILHDLISSQSPPAMVRVLLDFDPKLLLRENAVGRTPAEVAHDMYVASRIKRPEGYYSYYSHNNVNHVNNMLQADVKQFLPQEGDDDETAGGRPAWKSAKDNDLKRQAELLDLCKEYLARNTDEGKSLPRRLVSLNEANDVARRLGESYQEGRYYVGDKPREEDADEEDNYNRYKKEEKPEQTDFVSERGYCLNNAWRSSRVEDGDIEVDE